MDRPPIVRRVDPGPLPPALEEGMPAAPPSVRSEFSPGLALTEKERQFVFLMSSRGYSEKAAFVLTWPETKRLPEGEAAWRLRELRKRTRKYYDLVVAEAADAARIGRAALIEMAIEDREFARMHGNPGAAVAATKNIAALAGIKTTADMAAERATSDPVALLEAVERLTRLRHAAERDEQDPETIDITPDSGY